MTQEQFSQPAASSDGRFVATVGVLLVVIIVALGWLWIKERRARIAAQQEQAETVSNNSGKAMQSLMERLKSGEGTAAVAPPIRRDDLPAQTIDLQGRQHTLFHVSQAAGNRMGFKAGDVIVVLDQPPTTQPTGKGD